MHCCRGKPSCYFLSPDLELLAHALSQQELARVPSAGQCSVHSTACPGGEDNLVVTRSANPTSLYLCVDRTSFLKLDAGVLTFFCS